MVLARGLRFRFSKGPEIRFISHLDLARTMERAVRRAKLPIAFSQGFHPFPKIVFATALAVGWTSSGEYMDLQFTEDLPPLEGLKKLKAVLPSGLAIMEATSLAPDAPGLAVIVNAAAYSLTPQSTDLEGLRERTAAVLAAHELMITKPTKKGPRQRDIRPLLYELKVQTDQSQPVIHLLCACGASGNLRPDQLLPFLNLSGEDTDVHREQLYHRSESGLVTPIDRKKGDGRYEQ